MAYDSNRGRAVLFGGLGSPIGTNLNDTWEWDGDNWTQVAVQGPSARNSFAMAYDSKRQQIVLFGGSTGLNLAADTWLWNGTKWTQAATTGPSARQSHAIAYDSTHDQTVLFGGFSTTNAALGDTWAWDGSKWTQVSDFGAPPCALASLAFKGDSVALFGGGIGTPSKLNQVYGSTWTWDGTNWTLRQDFGPSPRFGASMCYDSKRGTLVLFGGGSLTQTTSFTDTWEHSEGP